MTDVLQFFAKFDNKDLATFVVAAYAAVVSL